MISAHKVYKIKKSCEQCSQGVNFVRSTTNSFFTVGIEVLFFVLIVLEF